MCENRTCFQRISLSALVAFLLCTAGISTAIHAETTAPEKVPVFNETDYRDPALRVSKRIYSHAELQITLIQVKRIKGFESLKSFLATPNEPPNYCRAWLIVQHSKNSGKVLNVEYYPDIHPLGSAYGLFVPESQPSPEYFTVVKLGDYHGQLILIRRDGTTSKYLGGSFFVTSDRKFLFSDYSSDSSGLTVFDLTQNRAIFSSTIDPYIQDWYQSEIGYFFTETDWETEWPYKGKSGVIHIFDLTSNSLATKPADLSQVKDAKKIKYDFYPYDEKGESNYNDCSSHQSPDDQQEGP